jgi:hypothetical protein
VIVDVVVWVVLLVVSLVVGDTLIGCGMWASTSSSGSASSLCVYCIIRASAGRSRAFGRHRLRRENALRRSHVQRHSSSATACRRYLIYPTTPPKDPILVMILNLIVAGGVGYIIMGQKTKGIVAIAVWVIGGVVTCGALAGVVSILGAIDGYLQAQQLQQGHPLGEWTFFNDHK